MSKTTYIHVDQHAVRRNAKDGTRDPVITVRDYTQNRRGFQAQILDDAGRVVCEILYSPDEPILSCGARVVIKTQQTVIVSQDVPPPEPVCAREGAEETR